MQCGSVLASGKGHKTNGECLPIFLLTISIQEDVCLEHYKLLTVHGTQYDTAKECCEF